MASAYPCSMPGCPFMAAPQRDGMPSARCGKHWMELRRQQAERAERLLRGD